MRARNMVLLGGLALAVGVAVVSLGAQDPARAPEPRRSVMLLEGPGSQLGVTVRDLAAAGAKDTALQGVRIEDVPPGSPAEKAGLKEGDVVVEFDGERVRSVRQFTRLVQETPVGRTVKVAIVRAGERRVVDATPESRPFSWTMDIDGARLRGEIERGLRNLPEELRGLGSAWVGRSRLGVTVQSLSAQLAEYFGVKDGGALVTRVTRDSAAEKAGLKAGDVIISVNGDRVRDADDLTHEIAGVAGEVTLGIVRDKKEMMLKAAIAQ